MKLSISKPLLILLALVAALVPEVAFAQDLAFPFTPSDGDKSREWFIKGLFGGLDGGGADPLANIVGIFNSAVLLLGGVLLFYTLIGGTVRTAGEGKVLGKWDSVWLPLRTVLGVAAILPGPSGYAFIQYVVIWLALQGIGIADVMSSRFVSTVLTDNSGTSYSFEVANIKPEISSVVRQMVMNSACVAVFDATIDANDVNTRSVFNMTNPNRGRAVSEYNIHPNPDTKTQTLKYRFGCGNVSFMPRVDAQTDASQLRLINTEVLSQLRDSVWETHNTYKDTSMTAAASLGAQVAAHARNGTDPEVVAAEVDQGVDTIATVWAQAVIDKAKEQSQDIVNQKTVESIQSDGWIMLGSIYMQIALSMQTISETMSILPEASNPDGIIEGSRKETQEDAGFLSKTMGTIVRFAKGEKAMLGEAAPHIMYAVLVTDNSAEGNDTASASPKGMMSSIMRAVTRAFAGIDIGATPDKNPVILASEIGNRLVLSTTIAIGIAAIVAGVAGLKATVGTNIVLVMVSIFSPMMVALLGAGLTLSYYIPMIPYILWLGAVFGWVILIVEAVIAAPLWAVTHLAPDGDGVVGRGGQGYMLVLSLTLRPALMVFGFAAAVAVMDPMGRFLNETFMGAFFGSVSPGWAGVLKILAGSIIYTTILLMVINRVFSLIHQIPDGILRWIGGGDNIIGREAEQASSGAGKAIMASTAAATAIGAVQGGAQQVAQGARQVRMERAQRRNAEAGTAAQLAGNAEDKASRGLANANESVSNLDANAENFESQAQGVQKQADSAAVSNVASIATAAKATIAADKAADGQTENAPTKEEVDAANKILSSIRSSGADRSPEAARAWLGNASSSGAYTGTKFNSQIGNAAGGLQGVDNKLAEARNAHRQMQAESSSREAMGSVGDIHASATDTLERAGNAMPGDPDAPTQAEVTDAQNIKDDIESSGALNSPEDAKSWLSNAQDKFAGTTMSGDISLAASRVANAGRSGGGGSPPPSGGSDDSTGLNPDKS